MKSKVDVRLCVFSSTLSAERIGEQVGIPPEKVIQRGSPRSKSPTLKHEKHVWMVMSEAPDDSALNEHIASLRSKIQGRERQIASLQTTCAIECSCIVKCDSVPAVHVSADLIRWLSEIGASLDVDLYIS